MLKGQRVTQKRVLGDKDKHGCGGGSESDRGWRKRRKCSDGAGGGSAVVS
jgi:hypothetical protein